MRKLGTISHISNKGRAIIRSDKTPGFGLPVYNGNEFKIGFVYDIFGPTKNPYVSVKIYAKYSKNLENRVGDSLYIPPKSSKRGRIKRRKK
jgi:RNA-binding protein